MKKIQTLILGFLLFGSMVYGQYSESFDIPNKGILSGPCSGSDGTTCTSNDFAGVNWTIEGNLSGIDSEPFATNGAGVLYVTDVDEEACWVSPLLNITGTASFSLDLSWVGYEDYNESSVGSKDYIQVDYQVDGGGWTPIGNVVGGGPKTISYNSPGANSGNATISQGSITGSTLRIRVCLDHNNTSEPTSIDNVSATGADVPGSGPSCDIAITGITVGGEDCPATDDGSLIITATTTNGPILYQITGPVTQSNATGVFTGLPTGTYTITVDDGSFIAGTCTDTDTRTIAAGMDNTAPTASNPAPVTVDCPDDIPSPDVLVVTDETDGCTIPCPTDPWINEFHYDNTGADAGEFVEVAGPAGIDLSNYTIYTYDGSDRMVHQVRALSGIIDNESNGFGAVVEYIANLQNSTEGIALVRNPNTVIEFLSYEGSFLALDGPAQGLTSTDVGIAEPTTQATNESLSRIGTGNIGSEFTFADQLATPGTLNGNQTIVPCPENAPVVTFQGDSDNGGAGTSSNPYIVTRTYRVTDGAGNFINVMQTLTANNCGPANDDCAGATPLSCGGAFNGTIDEATNTDAPSGCTGGGTPQSGLWFNLAGTGDVVTISTAGSTFNTQLNAYEGSCGNLSCVAGDSGPGSTSEITFCSASGTNYYIYLDGDVANPTGDYTISVSCATNPPPSISCPANIVTNTDAGQCGAIVNFSVTGSDNCGTPTITENNGYASGDLFPVGTTSLNWTATDAGGETATCSFSITVNDNEAPTIDCSNLTPGITRDTRSGFCDYVVQGDEFAPAGYSDNCAAGLSIEADYTLADNLDGAVFPVGTTTVSWTVTDGAGLTANCNFNVMIEDNEAPTALCQDITATLDASGNLSISDIHINGGSTDACGIASLQVSPSSFGCGNVGANSVTLTVTDVSGNFSTCNATVTIEDNAAPTAVCQDVTVQLDANGDGSITANEVNNGSDDACGIGNLSVSPNTFDCDNVGDNTVTLTVTDNNGNPNTCTANVTVEDNVAPIAVCKDATIQLNASGTASISPSDVNGGSTDACGITATFLSRTGFFCDQIGDNTIYVEVYDGASNSSSCLSTVTVEDNIAPTAVCQDATVQLNENGNASIAAANLNNGSSDNCSIASLSATPNTFDCDDIGSNTVVLTVTDVTGNSSPCNANVTVEDNAAPTAVCQDFTLNLDNDGTTILDPASIDGGSSTACGTFSLSVLPNSFDCDDLDGGPYTVTLTVTDDSNSETDNCTANITVADPNSFCCDPPAAVCQDITVQLDANGEASITAADIDNGSTADCGLQSLTVSPTNFTCDDKGDNTVTLTITDVNNDTDNCNATVTVEDNVAPNAVCQDITVQLDASGNASITHTDIDGGSSDNCTFFLLSIDNNSFSCSEVGDNTVVLTVSDFAGNNNDCNATVTVEDNVAPVALCQDITVQLDANGNGSITATDVDNGSNDACGIANLAVAPTTFVCSDIGANTVTLTVTDNNGNSNTCTATATVEDNVPPTITECEGNFAVFNGEEEISSASVINFTATDACGIAGTTYSPEVITCDQLGVNVPVTIVVTDNNGQASTCIAIVKTDGLPCGFMDFDEDGIGCEDSNEVTYDVPSETFTVESDGCYTTNFSQDNAAYVKSELCGDGEIIAHVTNINPSGQGWAGITMRESEAPGAKKVELLVNLGNIIRRAIRTTTNGFAYPGQFYRPQATWLKIVRSGNLFVGYASSNGVTWQNVLVVNIPMSPCIQAGLFVTNYSGNTIVSASFDNVEVNEFGGGMNLQLPDTNGQPTDLSQGLDADFSFFPNPVTGELQVDLGALAGRTVQINIYNQVGQVVVHSETEEAGYQPKKVDLSSLSSGIYFIEVISGDFRQMKKMMKTDR